MRLARVVALVALVGPVVAQDPEKSRRVRRLDVSTRNVFTEEEARGNLLFGLANLLHWPTQQRVLRQEAWFGPGDEITEAEVEEYERALRRLYLFGDIQAELLEVGDDEADVVVDSRDKFSLVINGGLAFVGGNTSVNGAIGDSNLFGSGKAILAEFSTDDRDTRTVLRYYDPQVVDGTHRLAIAAGQTDEGPVGSIDLTKPFRNRYDDVSYGMGVDYQEFDIDYFRNGDVVASLPTRRASARFFGAQASGPPEDRHALGIDFDVTLSEYDAATGPEAGNVRVPGDTSESSVGAYWTRDRVWEYRKLTGLDALDFIEDVQLGFVANARVAGLLRDEEGLGTELQPVLGLALRWADSPLTDTYLTFEGSARGRWYSGDAQGWALSGALHAFNQSLPYQTLAASLTYDAANELQGPEVQFTLGEDNGLRGYPARQFAGTRFVRLNLEDRVVPDWELWSVYLGVTAFFDAAWVHSDDLSMSDAIQSVGIGLRFGSSHLIGARVFRLDLAVPLDDVNGQSFGVSVSFAAGQVFHFFGNDAVLRSQFGI